MKKQIIVLLNMLSMVVYSQLSKNAMSIFIYTLRKIIDMLAFNPCILIIQVSTLFLTIISSSLVDFYSRDV